jgi:hypothetical protein
MPESKTSKEIRHEMFVTVWAIAYRLATTTEQRHMEDLSVKLREVLASEGEET